MDLKEKMFNQVVLKESQSGTWIRVNLNVFTMSCKLPIEQGNGGINGGL